MPQLACGVAGLLDGHSARLEPVWRPPDSLRVGAADFDTHRFAWSLGEQLSAERRLERQRFVRRIIERYRNTSSRSRFNDIPPQNESPWELDGLGMTLHGFYTVHVFTCSRTSPGPWRAEARRAKAGGRTKSTTYSH